MEYVNFQEIDPADFLPLLNKQTTREHLIEHQQFDVVGVTEWMRDKIEVDSTPGCRVRAINVDSQLAGWCGIQADDGNYEIAVVLDDQYWGLGRSVFQDLMAWAKELGHSTVYIHFLHTRPEYRFLRKMSRRVFESEMMGERFVSYELEVK
ncbi:N-acetyltransferase [Neptuniibacter sp.]|uniref:N-acetyltransferase n=1 Tax=Neptuniibacter sp. TaxID=1962643 RepID=UPI003B5B2513